MRHLPIYLILTAALMALWCLPEVNAAATAAASLRLPDSIAASVDTAQTPRLNASQRRRERVNEASADTTGQIAGADSTSRHSLSTGPRIVRAKVDLDNPVDFQSTDSIAMQGTNKAYLYGQGKVTYGSIKLDADQIDMDINKSTVYAIGRPDSTGEVIGTPVFDDNGQSYESKTMTYNFDTGRGFITDVITQQGEGYLTGGVTKKVEDNVFYTQDGKYTTCDDHEHPHFYMQLTKAKIRPGKDIVTGPAYMVLAGLPLPLAVPFGYFPFSEKYSSGVIFPSFGDDYNRGFYLSNGGYYFAFNDNVDLALTGEVYTKGSWGLQARSAYVKRYRYSGSFSASYLKTILGDKGSADYSVQTNMQILWSHTQDAKANPNLNFSASVNFTTSGYSRNDLNSYYNSAFTENTKSSTINATWRPAGTKWTVSGNMNLSQRTQDSTLTVGFPSITASYSQFFPFKRKNGVGKERWYEKIKMSYSGQFNNSLTAKQNVFFKKSLIKDWSNGMRHSIPISATFTAFKYFNVTPSVNLTDRMYTTKVKRMWDPNAAAEIMDTSYSFYNVFDFTASVAVDTKLYGFYRPWKIFGDKIKMIRHVMTPSVSFSATPDFSDPMWGIYGSYERPDAQGNMIKNRYSMFPGSLFGVPGAGKSGTVTYALANNLEMKVRNDNDSIEGEDKKVSLIENLQLSQSYNFAADSLRFSNINSSVMLRLTKNFTLNLQAIWDVYTYALNSSGNPVRVNKLRLTEGKGLGKLSSTGTSFSYTFNNDTFKKLREKRRGKGKSSQSGDGSGGEGQQSQGDNGNQGGGNSQQGAVDADGYVPWAFPWSLSVNYSIAYAYGDFNKEKLEYNGKITQNLSFSGSIKPTPNWDFSFSCSYDFNLKKIAYMNCNVSRNLHCFVMTASFIPVGPYKSYNFHIAVSSSLLSDLKYDKRSSLSNGVNWY
ncbi:MAG: LPS-assembly protein LptD [Paramuribaculum sp.]